VPGKLFERNRSNCRIEHLKGVPLGQDLALLAKIKKLASDNHSSLICPFFSDEEKKSFITLTFVYLHRLRLHHSHLVPGNTARHHRQFVTGSELSHRHLCLSMNICLHFYRLIATYYLSNVNIMLDGYTNPS
jgi:hypothetical protein